MVASRLLYGCAVWSDVSAAQIKQVEAVIIDHHRRIHDEGFWQQTRINDEAFTAQSKMIPFRILWARNRLVYLQALSKHGRPYHLQLLLLEFKRQRGWLWEVCTDLQWMEHLVELPITIPTTGEEWRVALETLSQCTHWKALVSRACRRQLLQEQLAIEVQTQHHAIVQHLRQHGCEVIVPEETEETTQPKQLLVMDNAASPLRRLMHWPPTCTRSMEQCRSNGLTSSQPLVLDA